MTLKIDFRDGDAIVWRLTADSAIPERVTAYTPTLLVYAPDDADLQTVRGHLARLPAVETTAIEPHRPSFRHEPKPMCRVEVGNIDAVTNVARQVRGWGAPGEYRFYDVDLSPEFRYCLETDTDPAPDDSRDLRVCLLAADERALAADPLRRLSLDGTTVTGADAVLTAVIDRLTTVDPDVLVVSHAAIVTRLFELAARLDREFKLGRGSGFRKRAARSMYTSYGNVGYSPARYSVPGRVIINQQHSFLWHETNLDGCVDLVRRSGKPLQELGWASIGNVLTAIQIREARHRDVRVPWHSWRHEFFKPMRTLHDADRGGFTFEPDVGVHENVHELDFSSLYPNIMVTRNVSPETVRCACHNTDDVPGLGYSICADRGYLADVLEPIIGARRRIKRELRATANPGRTHELQGKSAALKWILVSCFGYQGFSNAKFGRIECHEAINAFARELLLDAKERLEAAGWRVVHGIVDSLWVTAMPDCEPTPLETVCAAITDAVDIELEREATYDWIAFVPQRQSDAGALTKYFGRTADGGADTYKYRGIECRQRSTCAYVTRVQRDLIRAFDEHREPVAVCDCLQRRLAALDHGVVDATDLLITQRVSRPLSAYDRRTRTVAALERAEENGLDIHPGESVEYVVAADGIRSRECVRLAFETDAATDYDATFYRERLLRAAESVLAPAGWRQDDIEQYLAGRHDASLTAYR